MTTSEPDESTRRVLDGTAWRDFCRALEAAGDVILDPRAPADPRNRAEGFRYLSRLTRAALETFIEDADPPITAATAAITPTGASASIARSRGSCAAPASSPACGSTHRSRPSTPRRPRWPRSACPHYPT